MNIKSDLGAYRLQRLLRKGGMAELWLARWRRGDAQRSAAIKILPPERRSDRELTQLFRREIALAAKLSHAHIVQLYDAGRWRGRDFAAFAFNDGANLSDILKFGPLSHKASTAVLAGVGAALAHVHAQRPALVHGDVSPENILVNRWGWVRLCDFGVARYANEGAPMLRGKPAYLAPEQLTGAPALPASDQYALGLVYYECLVGAPAYAEAAGDEGKLLATVAAGAWRDDATWRQAPATARRLAERMLAKNAANRFVNMTAVVADCGPIDPSALAELGERAAQAAETALQLAPTLKLPRLGRWRQAKNFSKGEIYAALPNRPHVGGSVAIGAAGMR